MTVPGWHLSFDRRVPFLVVPNSKNFKDSYPQFNRNDFPFRSTIILKGHIWEVVEVAEERQDEGEIEECEGNETTVVSFFHQLMEDVNGVGIIHTGADDPSLQPLLRERQKRRRTTWRTTTRTAGLWLVWKVFGRRRLYEVDG